MNEEELKKLKEELEKKQDEIDKREADLTKREEALNEEKADTEAIIKGVKDEYEKKLLELTNKYEKRLQERDKVIKQLLSGNGDANKPNENIIIDKINARRIAQNKKW